MYDRCGACQYGALVPKCERCGNYVCGRHDPCRKRETQRYIKALDRSRTAHNQDRGVASRIWLRFAQAHRTAIYT